MFSYLKDAGDVPLLHDPEVVGGKALHDPGERFDQVTKNITKKLMFLFLPVALASRSITRYSSRSPNHQKRAKKGLKHMHMDVKCLEMKF